ncbi:PHP domain-containing protein [Hydrogenothermus marinus]|uniref:Polymerase/histidinol phosphatase N-terminal domain-containing protein n=1 Tax=Hydrogenothermus marinus TaxID=133270 RepID=A0A3M0BHJ4_9AQUI|nr:PHP domain-containing protein [Hydrogenothermus marinus]RMA96046.1 hypothetical protein CLV39_1057 [Hydrogenothermus marinus]
MIELLIFILAIYIIFWEFYPYKILRLKENGLLEDKFPNVNLKKYKVIAHIHTQFSFDSLGKPSDIKKAMEINNIDFVFVTDHNNDDYKYFEDNKIFAGIEINTENGRLLKLGNILPVISHPNNFEFEHYKWKGDFKEGYLYELIDIKDMVVWSKLKTGLKLLKNILIYPFTLNVIRKWNALIPLEKWIDLYWERASHLKIIGGLDLHIKFVYQEHTHGILIPSYKSGFKWLVNYIITDKEIKTKEEVLQELKKGRSFLVLNHKFGDIFIKNNNKFYFLGDEIPEKAIFFVKFKDKKLVKILKKDNKPILITEKNQFSYKLNEKGKYHLEVYEYDFKIFNFYFGFRPTGITNWIEVK